MKFTGFSFFQSSPVTTGNLLIWSGLNGTGDLLGFGPIFTTRSSCAAAYNARFCTFNPAGFLFAGLARSVTVVEKGPIALDDTTFGTSDAGIDVTPEPSSMAFVALGLSLLLAKRRN